MDFLLKPLPYPTHALEPTLGRQAVALHHEKHQAGHLRKLEQLLGGRPEARQSLEWIVRVHDGPVFDHAAQLWSHDFYWRSMHPDGGGAPSGELADVLHDAFGGLDAFRASFLAAGIEHFGSGWLWLVSDRGRARVVTTSDADLPLRHGGAPLLVADLWEHAYYLDYRDERARYLEGFLDRLANWEFAAGNWSAARAGPMIVRRRAGG